MVFKQTVFCQLCPPGIAPPFESKGGAMSFESKMRKSAVYRACIDRYLRTDSEIGNNLQYMQQKSPYLYNALVLYGLF